MSEYKLPDVGEGLTEAELISWQVQVGDVIAINDIVCEIETAKSIVELPSPYAGTVEALLVDVGETVEVGTPIIRIAEASGNHTETSSNHTEASEGRAATDASAQERDASTQERDASARERDASTQERDASVIDTNVPPAEGANTTLVGYGPKEVTAQRRARRVATPNSPSAAATQMQIQGTFMPGVDRTKDIGLSAVDEGPGRDPRPRTRNVATGSHDPEVMASPAVRKLAKDRGIDLSSIVGTGPNGSITREDLGGSPTTGRESREPIKGVRKMMGQAMVESAFTAPHVTEWVSVDMTRTMEFVRRVDRATPLLVLARACLLAARRTPEINSTWDEAAQEVVIKHYVNLGIAAATPRGLVVPNVKDADRLDLDQLADAFDDLISTARAGRTQPADTAGGTFTITNVGVFGVDGGTPIINPGESAILCFGAVKRQPWVVGEGPDERIEIRDVGTLALSFDHRHIDGEKGSRFLADVAAIMADPATALLY